MALKAGVAHVAALSAFVEISPICMHALQPRMGKPECRTCYRRLKFWKAS